MGQVYIRPCATNLFSIGASSSATRFYLTKPKHRLGRLGRESDQDNGPAPLYTKRVWSDPNEDRFIREGYYSGHVDTYIVVGEKLHYYDVNSLYPFVIKENIMPNGWPVWDGDLGE
ncbi:hypothetical protein RND71_001888 [Anisodus tanguticus]|uniref:DNA-directed DNA polymerase n=1 Tax=Anisodus tanguticus TaxID=243964 RepID=A0AAE1T1W5_9SOLA|nr:hypothetical protein RND71_001888 [Anisodus tanguticus]